MSICEKCYIKIKNYSFINYVILLFISVVGNIQVFNLGTQKPLSKNLNVSIYKKINKTRNLNIYIFKRINAIKTNRP